MLLNHTSRQLSYRWRRYVSNIGYFSMEQGSNIRLLVESIIIDQVIDKC